MALYKYQKEHRGGGRAKCTLTLTVNVYANFGTNALYNVPRDGVNESVNTSARSYTNKISWYPDDYKNTLSFDQIRPSSDSDINTVSGTSRLDDYTYWSRTIAYKPTLNTSNLSSYSKFQVNFAFAGIAGYTGYGVSNSSVAGQPSLQFAVTLNSSDGTLQSCDITKAGTSGSKSIRSFSSSYAYASIGSASSYIGATYSVATTYE